MWQRVVLCASLLGVAALIGCGSSPTSPSDPGLSELTSAPTRIEADGTALTLVGHLNRDFMPAIEPGGGPLLAVLRIETGDGSPVPAAIRSDRAWVIRNGEVWTSEVEQTPRDQTTPDYIVTARNGPKWGPGVTVDVVARVINSRGGVSLLRAPAQTIGRSE